MAAIIFFVISISFVMFRVINKLARLRVGEIYEIVGFDVLADGSDIDEQLSNESISKLEMRQRFLRDKGNSKKENRNVL